MNANQRIRIDTGTNIPVAGGGSPWTTTSTETRWCEVASISPAQAVQRYGCELDEVVRFEFRFYDRPTIGLGTSRFIWATDGHPNEGMIYKAKSSPVNADGQGIITTLLVEFTGETEEAEDE